MAGERSSTKMKKTPKKRRTTRAKRVARGEGGNGGRHGKTDHEEATYGDRCSKDGKVEEHPLEPVRPLGACLLRPDEAKQARAFAALVLARPPKLHTSNELERYSKSSDSLVKSEQRKKAEIR